ncbi:MAG: EAL domain-containing protein [Lysobacteraceae bacterium]
MTKTISSQQDEYRQAFLRHLPKRIETIEARIQRYLREGWDAPGLSILNDDVQRLAGASGRYDLIEPSQHLLSLENMLGEHMVRKTLPNRQQSERMLALMGAIMAALAPRPDAQRNSGHSEMAPERYWQRWVKDAPAPGAEPPAQPEPATASAPTHARIAAAQKSLDPAKPAVVQNSARRIYHLNDGNPLAFELGQRLETAGYELEPVETADELIELLMSLSPHMVLVDASHAAELAAVGDVRRTVQQRTHNRILFVAMANQDNLQVRLDARRAGVDALLLPPFSAADVLLHLQTLLSPAAEDMVRVLIVEDDRSQALFAQSVLTNAGMQAVVEQDSMMVLDALDALHPDLVLMDLHMPHANGVELTALIREHPGFAQTPIVFLSGESDPEMRYEAIDAGGDDFLSKPIRPKHLIAAVQNRVRRVRALMQHGPEMSARDEATGLHRRAYVLDRVNDAIGAVSDRRSTTGGVLFLEIDGTAALRDRLGLAALEQLLVAAGSKLSEEIGENYPAARINDSAFLVVAADLDDSRLDALAQHLRNQLMQHPFDLGGRPMRLRASVGICPLRFAFGDASSLLNTAERACRDARISDRGIKRHEPPKTSEMDHDAAIIDQLREAISHNGFELIYQPIVAVQGGHDAQYQTLLRLRDITGRLRSAGEILPLAERADLIVDIDRWVLTRAMSVLQQQTENGRTVRLFVPQSMTTFADAEQADWLHSELIAHGLSGSSLVLESRLEDSLIHPSMLHDFAIAMRNEGVQLCLGQYEHTAEADRLLDQIPLGFIKLAAKYVEANVPQTLRDELRAIIDRAHRLEMRVIGHRVEDAQSAATLWMSGIDYIQGNLVQGAADALDFDFNAAVL